MLLISFIPRLSSLVLALSLACVSLSPVAVASDAPDFTTTKQQAEQGDAGAQNNLGWMYKNGEGVRQDYRIAKEWYGKACDGGFYPSCDYYEKLNRLGY